MIHLSTVLLVDDSATMRKIVRREIDKIGSVVDEFIEAGDRKQVKSAYILTGKTSCY